MTNDRRERERRGGADRRNERAPSEDICWGRNPVIALLEGDPERCMKVLVSKGAQPHIKAKITELCRANGIIFQNVEGAALDRLTNGENHQGVAAYTAQMKLWEAEDLLASLPAAPAPVLLLLCDHLQDPHNLGAVIRSAEAAGAAAVMIPKRGGCLPTGTVVKTSAGAALRLPVVKVGNISQTIKLLQEADFWVTGLAMEGRETLFKEDLPPRSVIVVGAEGEGLGTAVTKACDDIRFIPMLGATGSLNASVAASLAMFEWSRSRRPSAQ
ncbi:23S rRNA (guanosine(2251)-2'-O)-methyltransferase RlmB [Cloacibacillus evryensis]|uniref:23S rRNA (guanosine(2251)-2'-O)-methyltransferase RlmB n=1 Tax=Cloacibacillus evryensis TaxID=508460 RepID=UPI0004B5837C|nr:23S rRNA (guanosine(2251)-2'-O)-methyltransferase RlmB [Cloacibacillus evryensis]MEA5034415.1 23S rRNA (guanosine(2251)-2'-O)-methyltransferase RlmB [Cloacibacillus evryensis]